MKQETFGKQSMPQPYHNESRKMDQISARWGKRGKSSGDAKHQNSEAFHAKNDKFLQLSIMAGGVAHQLRQCEPGRCIMMIYRLLEQGWTEAKALDEAVRIGLSSDAQKTFARNYINQRKAKKS